MSKKTSGGFIRPVVLPSAQAVILARRFPVKGGPEPGVKVPLSGDNSWDPGKKAASSSVAAPHLLRAVYRAPRVRVSLGRTVSAPYGIWY